MKSTKIHKGFTLIELLVVIAIIGLLSAIVLASLNIARAKGRDAVRLSELNQLQTAVETYYSDYGSYPLSCAGSGYWGGASASFGSCTTNYIVGLAPTYIGSLPLDTNNVGYGYIYLSNGTDYKIMSYQSAETITKPRCPSQCPNTGASSYCAETGDLVVYSAGGACW